jgi:hypothetical protein
MPAFLLALLPMAEKLWKMFLDFASSTIGQIVIALMVGWLFGFHFEKHRWNADIAAREAAQHAEMLRQQAAASEIAAAANRREDDAVTLAKSLQEKIDAFSAHEKAGGCVVDGQFGRSVQQFDSEPKPAPKRSKRVR